MPTVDIDRDAAYEAAQRELSKPIYPKGTLTDRFSEWLQELLYRILLRGSTLPGGWLTIVVLLILAAVAIFVAVRIARRTMRTNRGGDYQLFGAAELSAAEHRVTAEQCAARGDWAAIQGGIVGTKAAMQSYFGYGGYCRKPLPRPGKEETKRWRELFEEIVTLERAL